MTVYMFDDIGALVGPVELPPVPGLGVQLPSNAVQLAQVLPDPDQGKVWALVDSVPTQVEDHRGLIYDITSGAETYLGRLGPVPAGYTAKPRPDQTCVWVDGAWAVDLGYIHAGQMALINEGCEAAITAGFSSDALGEVHFYSSQLDDQLNLTGAILAGDDSVFACRDQAGQREFRPHTFEQLRQVGLDFTKFKLNLLQRAGALKALLATALADEDLEQIQSITWSSGL